MMDACFCVNWAERMPLNVLLTAGSNALPVLGGADVEEAVGYSYDITKT